MLTHKFDSVSIAMAPNLFSFSSELGPNSKVVQLAKEGKFVAWYISRWDYEQKPSKNLISAY